MLEVGVDHSVGESFTANTNAFKYTVTGELMHNQVRIDDTWIIGKDMVLVDKFLAETVTKDRNQVGFRWGE